MVEQRTCPQCGNALPANAPQGLCPACLLAMGSDGGNPTTAYPPTSHAPEMEDLSAIFPQLEILGLVGRGGMGVVYKARQPSLDRLVAIKILPSDVGRDPAFAERFSREARALARLNHPNIVAVYDSGHVGGLYYFIMEYVDGVNLRQAILAEQITPAKALAIVPQICDALQYAHEEGVVHRDIKPENVLLDKRGRVKVADFGLAKLLGLATPDYTLTGTSQAMGTLHYMAPEQYEKPQSVDHRADIYSLGVVFYELLTGKLPLGRFDLPSHKVDVDVRLDQVVLKTLEREPDRRYQYVSEVKTDVEQIAVHSRPRESDRPGLGPPMPVHRSNSDPNSSRTAAIVLGIVALAMLPVGCVAVSVLFAFVGRGMWLGLPVLLGGLFLVALLIAGITLLVFARNKPHLDASAGRHLPPEKLAAMGGESFDRSEVEAAVRGPAFALLIVALMAGLVVVGLLLVLA